MDYEKLTIKELDSRDSARVVAAVLSAHSDDAIERLTSVTHHTEEEWLATIIESVLTTIGRRDEII